MKKSQHNIAHYLFLLLITATILFIGNFIALLYLMGQWKQVIPVSRDFVLDNLEYTSLGYQFSNEGRDLLAQENLFAMIINNDGDILWSERLPDNLNKKYTLQDVAVFTRYYLDNYPVHTYTISEGLLVIGGPKDSIWKYTIEYDSNLIRSIFSRQLPIMVLVNICILFLVPLLIQRKWVSKKEIERTEWIAGVSHDIRTPLTLIIGNSDYIKENTESELIATKASVIEKQGLRIRALVTNLNMSSKLTYGVGSYEIKPNSINAALRKITADIINREPGDQYSFNLDIADNSSSTDLSFNEELFTRMVENLINNSIAHNPDGCNIFITLKSKNNHTILEISDDGIGATTKIYKHLNSKKSLTATMLGEHGIGLRVVKQIALFHKWKISFSPNEPKGFLTSIIIHK